MKLFVYGTLQFPEIIHALLGSNPEMEPAKAIGYRAAKLKDRLFPGLVKEKDSMTDGFVLDLKEKQYEIIAEWEDEKYIEHFFESTEIEVKTAKSNKHVRAFLWNEPKIVLRENWNKEEFYRESLEIYIDRINAYLSEL